MAEKITEKDIRGLQSEAKSAGDQKMVKICDKALRGDKAARKECERVILDNRANKEASVRTRTTWAASDRRRASAPPANPGYGVENIQHPAYYDDPAYEAYKKGDPSAWAEDPHQPPYSQGNPPAVPGYDVEDGHHPAFKAQPRFEKIQPKQATLVAQVEEKAGMAYRLAQAMFRGKKASAAQVEDQALDLMDLPTETIQASLDRLGGGFLAMPEDDFGDDGFDDGFDDGLDGGPFMGMDDDDDFGDDMFARRRRADQNAYPGPTQGPGPQAEQAERAEQKAISNGETKMAAAQKLAFQVFATYDSDGDGFVTIHEWSGNRALFAAIDTDGDGVISREEFVAMTASDDGDEDDDDMGDDFEAKKKATGHDLYADLDPEEAAMLAAMQDEMACGQVMASDDNDEDDEDGDEDVEAKKKASRIRQLKAELRRLAGDDEEEEEDDEDEDVEAKKKANRLSKLRADIRRFAGDDDEEEDDEDEDVEAKKKANRLSNPFALFASDDDDDDDEDPEGKEASAYFAQVADPMGLAEGAIHMSAEEKATLESLFEMDTPASTTASLEDVLNPKPRQASEGVRQLGQMTRSANTGGAPGLDSLWETKPNVDEHFGM